MKTELLLLITACSFIGSIKAEKTDNWTNVNIYRKSTLSIKIVKYATPLEIKWGKVQKTKGEEAFLWEEALLNSNFFLYNSEVNYDTWKTHFSRSYLDSGLLSEKAFKAIKERYTDESAYKKSREGKLEATQWINGEIWLKNESNQEYCILALFDKESLSANNNKPPVSSRAKLFVLEEGKLKTASKKDYETISNIPNIGILPIASWKDMDALLEAKIGLSDIESIIRPASGQELTK